MTPKQADAFEKFLRMLDSHGWLPYFMVVGSWAEFLYSEAEVLDGFDPYLRTMDIDILVRNLRRPSQKVSLVEAARKEGYVLAADYMDGVTKLYDDSGLEIEFLIGQMGSGTIPALATNVGVTAQALRHLDVLLHNPMEAHWRDMEVIVPKPEAYAAHKMAINDERKAKAEKDAAEIKELWPYLDRNTFDDIASKMSKRERAHISCFMEEQGLQ
ncbi:MAG: GSU2403 family nucleotidyltransferase fold protein [Atopobiaceae bacterium]|jgi:hypothetical protein|nr:GSU2403 family nucleotidyltransferase fold protein [Atopobiaceae bacterium]